MKKKSNKKTKQIKSNKAIVKTIKKDLDINGSIEKLVSGIEKAVMEHLEKSIKQK